MRLVCALLVLCLAAGCAAVIDGGRGTPYRTADQPSFPPFGSALPAGHTRYSNESLASVFVRLTHDLEWGGRRPHLVRYETPVSVGVTGRPAPQYTAFIDRFLANLRAQTGIRIARSTAPHNLTVNFIPGQQFRQKLPQHFCVVAPGSLTWDEFKADPVKHGTRSFERNRTLEAMSVYIPDNLEPYLIRLCLIEEIVQALGPANDLFALGPSLFNDDNVHVWPTKLDYLMLRVLYAPEMRTGLDRTETRRRASALLSKLNAEGSAAAPPLRLLSARRMQEWTDLVTKADADDRRQALDIARRQMPGTAYHCHSLIALARLQRQDPETSLRTLSEAERICIATHGVDDLRTVLIRLELARALFKTGKALEAYQLSDGLAQRLAAFGKDERLVALYDLQAAALRAIQQGTKSFEARRRAGEWGAYALGRDHADVLRLLPN